MRMYTTTEGPPTADEVRKAHAVLGTSVGMAFPDIRKKYLQMAKEHHPDVAGAGTKVSMGDINLAYEVLQRNSKHGGGAGTGASSSHSSSSSSSSSSSAKKPSSSSSSSSSSYKQHHYGAHWADGPMWDEGGGGGGAADFNEAMWQAMRGGAKANSGGNPFGGPHSSAGSTPYMDEFEQFLNYAHKAASYDDGFRNRFRSNNSNNNKNADKGKPKNEKGSNSAKGGNNSNSSASGSSSGNAGSTGSNSANSGGDAGASSSSSSNASSNPHNFSATEQAALKNMYEDGKSFEFIANALGKSAQACMEVFNSLRSGGKGGGRNSGGRGGGQYNNNRGGRGGRNKYGRGRGGMGGGMPPYGSYIPMDEDDYEDMCRAMGMAGYGPGEHVYFGDVAEEEGMDGAEYMDFGEYAHMMGGGGGGPKPFGGRHYMHRGGGGGGRGRGGRGRGGDWF